MSIDPHVKLYGQARADDGQRIHDLVSAVDGADSWILTAELALDRLDVHGDDGDLNERDRADAAHEIETARRALRNLTRIALGHAADLQEFAGQKGDDDA